MEHLTYRGKLRLADLEDKRQHLKNQLARCDALIANVKRIAVDDGVAAFVEGNPRWSAPAKDWWMANHGVAMWEKVRKPQNISPIFTWLIN